MLQMNDFDEITKNWKEQPVQKPTEKNFMQLKDKIGQVTKGQRIANVVLVSTVIILIIFFFYVGAINHKEVALAISTMIIALVIRVLLEIFSIKGLKNLSASWDIQKFKQQLQKYYKRRILVHTVLTPVLLTLYCFAFWTLMPVFKANLSEWLYNYVFWSSLVLLPVFIIFFYVQIRKELFILRDLKRE